MIGNKEGTFSQVTLIHSSSKETQHGKLCFFLGRVQIDELRSVFHFANALGNNVPKLLSEPFDKIYMIQGRGQ